MSKSSTSTITSTREPSRRQRGVGTHEPVARCVWFRKTVFEARRDVLRLSDKQPNRNKLPSLILARVREIGEKRPNVQKILDSAGSSLAEAVKQVSNHYRQHERLCSSTEYFYWQWKMLDLLGLKSISSTLSCGTKRGLRTGT